MKYSNIQLVWMRYVPGFLKDYNRDENTTGLWFINEASNKFNKFALQALDMNAEHYWENF
jgi:hypothetical protein